MKIPGRDGRGSVVRMIEVSPAPPGLRPMTVVARVSGKPERKVLWTPEIRAVRLVPEDLTNEKARRMAVRFK